MSYDFSNFITGAPRQFKVLEANEFRLVLARQRNGKGCIFREIYMITHTGDLFTLYRTGQYEKAYRQPELLQSDQYAILQARNIQAILAALGYDVRPKSAGIG